MLLYVAGFAAAVGIQAVASRGFIYSMGKLGETVVLELRQRLFLHFQRAAGRVPRALHLRAGHLPAGVRHRLHLRPVRRRPGRPGVRGALADPGGRRDAAAGLAAGAGGAGRLRPAGLADDVVPARVRARLPADPGNDRPGHRPLRGDLRRYPRGAGVPPGTAQRGDLRPSQRELRGGQPSLVPGPGGVRAGDHPGRQRGDRGRAVLRRAAGDRRRHQGRGAGHVPAVPGPVLRPAAGPVPVLQLVPVRRRLAGEDLRRAGRAARGAGARPPGAPAAARRPGDASRHAAARTPGPGAGRSGSRRCGSATGPRRCCPGWT